MKPKPTILQTACLLALMIVMGCATDKSGSKRVTPAESRAIAREAYIYANPLVDNYRILYGSFVDRIDPEYKTPLNQIMNMARVYTPDDKAVQAPNSDTPYSWLGMDLNSPVANDYYDKAPFKFEGTLKRLHFKYLPVEEPEFLRSPDDD